MSTQPTDPVKNILEITGDWQKFKGLPGTEGTLRQPAPPVDKLARFKLPRSIDYVTELPRDPNGKLYKRRLRDPNWTGRDRSI